MGWETLWKYQTVDYVRTAAVLKNTDLHIRMRSSLRGNRIRIEFANTYGNEPLTFESVIVSNGTDKSTVLHQKRSRITKAINMISGIPNPNMFFISLKK